MAAGKTLTVYLAADVSKFGRGMKEADTSLQGLAGKLKDNLVPILTAASAAAGAMAIKIGADAVMAASDLNETLNQSEAIFGSASHAITNFADNAATDLGQTRQQAIDAANTFGTFGKAAGLTGQRLADFSTQLVSLSTDLASFKNTRPEEAVQALGAALRGESEPMRRFGVLVDDATLKQRAMQMGIYDGNGALTQQQKVLAAHAEVLAQTTDAQGDFARTSDGLANTLRVLRASTEELKTEFGRGLSVNMAEATGKTNDLSAAMKNAQPAAFILGAYVSDFTKSLIDSNGPLGVFLRLLGALPGLQREITATGIAAFNTAGALQKMAGASAQAVGPVYDSGIASLAAAERVRKLTDILGHAPGAYEETAKAATGHGSAVEKTSPLIERQTAVIDGLIKRLGDEKQALQDAVKARDDYANSLSSSILGGISLKDVFNPEDVQGSIAKFSDAISGSMGFSDALAKLGSSLPNTPGAQTFISQIVGLGTTSGQAFLAGLTPEVANNLVAQLDQATTAANGTGFLLAQKFYGEGVEGATQLINGTVVQIAKEEKRLRKIGQNIGKPIGANIKAEIAQAVAEAVAAAEAAKSAAAAERAAQVAASQVTVTEQQVAKALQQLIVNADKRSTGQVGVLQ